MSKNIQVVPRWKTIANIFKILENPIPVLTGFLEEFGETYYLYAGGMNKTMVTTNPKIIQHVLQKNHRNYTKTPVQTKQLAKFAGKGLLTSEGPYWLQQRRLIQPGFHRHKIASLADIMNEVIIQSFKEFDEYANSQQSIDMAHVMMEIAFKAVAKSLFSTSVTDEEMNMLAKIASLADIMNEVIIQSFKEFDEYANSQQSIDMAHVMMEIAFKAVAKSLFSTSVTDEEMNMLAKNLTEIQEYFIKEVRQPFLHWYFQMSGKQKAYIQLADDSKQIILRIIHERRTSGKSHDDLLDMLLASRYEDTGEGMTDQQLLDEALIIFVAGHETSANALAWIFYLLSNHPKELEKLRNEAKSVLPNNVPTFLDLPKLEYGKWCIEEAMRLYPPAWITDRVALEDDEVDGIQIPKGMVVVPFIYGTHHSKNLWDNSEQFIPERFSKENKKQRPTYAYLPFGGGPRLCIGNNFAMMEMQLVVTHLIQRYDFELVKEHAVKIKPMITLRPKDGIMMKIKKRLTADG